MQLQTTHIWCFSILSLTPVAVAAAVWGLGMWQSSYCCLLDLMPPCSAGGDH